MIRILTTSLLTLLLASISAWSQQKIDGVAAIVGNEVILESEVSTMLTQYSFQTRQNIFKNATLVKQLHDQFLQQMIDEKILLIKAEEDTIKADDDRVEQVLTQQINNFIQQVGTQEKLEEYYGLPLPKIKKELRQQIANRMIIDQLRQKRFSGVKISRREVEQFFNTYRDSLPNIESTVDISHILLQVVPSEEATQQARARIEEIKKKLDAGADFTALADQFSEDPSVASNHGDLGWVNRGDFVKEFEEVAFALKDGQISDIVQTQFGFHIIKMDERQGEKIHVHHILIQLQPTAEDEQRVVSRLKEIRQKILSSEATFEEMALQNSDDPNVEKDQGHLGQYVVGNFQIKAFEDAISKLKVGEISEPFKTEFGYHILRLNNTQEARQPSLSQDWQQIEQMATDFKRRKEFEKWLSDLRQQIPVEIKANI